MLRIALALLLLSTAGSAAHAAPKMLIPDRDDIEITEDVVVAPGVHGVVDANGNGVLHIRTDGITVDLGVADLSGSNGDAHAGWGISVEGARDVTIRGGAMRGFKVAIRARNAANLRVIGVDVSGNWRQRLSSTPEAEDGGDWLWPHDNDELQWEKRYGAGISLVDCPGATVTGCRARRGQNGLLLSRCDRATITGNDFSFLSGWGLAMWRSSRGSVTRNRFDWCVRGYSHGVYDRGQDSTGVLIFEQCHDNVFAYNSATHGGDGFFLYAGHETTKRTGRGGCHGNIVYRNDFSHAVANGIEATFSERNVFLENRLDDCNYGVWAGYSRQTVVRGNRMRGCTIAGVAIEHGQDNVIEGNVIEECRTGVQLWWDEDPGLTGGVYGKTQETISGRTLIRHNRLDGCPTGVFLATTSDIRLVENEILRGKLALRLKGDCSGFVCSGNVIHADHEPNVRNETGKALRLGPDFWLSPLSSEGDAVMLEKSSPVRPKPARWRPLPEESPFLPRDAKRGRHRIIVDEWGPYDFVKPRLWPAEVRGGWTASLHLLGPDVPFEVVKLTGGIAVSPSRGRAPSRIEITRGPGHASIREGTVTVAVGEVRLTAHVRLVGANWTVRYHDWTEDPRKNPEAFRALLAGPPLHEARLEDLDLRWGARAPAPGVPADGFATVAETTLLLDSGTYEITTVSDDGVRVIVDGKTILENWTWHGATEDRARVKLTTGAHEIRVEHFDLDGWARLSLRIRPVPD